MTRRRTFAVGALVTFAWALLGAPSGVAAQEAPTASAGWWTRSPAQGAPAEGFAVASAPDGPVTVAAVVVDVSGTISSGTLSAVEVGGLGQQDAAVVVCPAAGPVSLPEEDGGALDDAPEADCARGSVPFERDADSMRWNADLSSLAGELGGDLSLVIVPAPSDAPVQPAFEVRLAAPEVDLRIAAADPTPPRTGPSPAPGPVADPSPSRPSVSFGGGLPPVESSPSVPFELDAVEPVVEGSEPVAADAPDPVGGAVEEEVAAPIRPAGAIGTGHGPQVGKALSYVVVSALAGAAVTGAGRLARRRQLLRG